MKKPFVIHPFLFGIYPIIFLYSYNIREVLFSEILLPLAIVLVFTLLFISFIKLIIRDVRKSGVVVSVFLILFFSYGRISDFVLEIVPLDVFLIHAFFMLLWSGLIIYCTFITIKTKRNLQNFTSILNAIALSLVVISLINIGIFEIKSALVYGKAVEQNKIQISQKPEKMPDIYYIILDRYASNSTLKEFYDFDNSEFNDYLTQKGFYVASQSTANYLATIHSLASSLNMDYFNYLSEEVGKDSDNWKPIFALLQDNKVRHFLKKNGYKYIFFGSGHWNSIMNKGVDLEFKPREFSEFLMSLYSTTMLYPFGAAFDFDKRREEWKRIMFQFDKLAEMPNIKGPTFVFAHMMVPHFPYVFDRDGNFVKRWEERKRSEKENYLEQLMFTSKKTEELIDKLLSNSEIPPIIILQSDEGPYPKRCRLPEKDFNCGLLEKTFNWKDATTEELREKFRILNAYYLPNVDKSILYHSITPVNSFRLIFNLYFNTNLKLLPDETYAFENFRYPYRFLKITDKVKYNK